MDIYQYIEKDHRAVADLMQQVVDDRDPQRRKRLLDKIRTELLLHLDSEEVTFYRAIERVAQSRPAVHEQMGHAEDEHQEVREYLMQLAALDVGDDAWIETFGEMKHAVSHHVEEEETQVWKKARALFDEDQAHQLAKDMAAVKAELRANPPLPGNIFDRPSDIPNARLR